MKNLTLMLLALLLFMLTGCASVSMVNSWKDPAAPAKQYRKLLVVGLADKSQTRQVFEEVFASELIKKGVSAIPSYTLTGSEGKPTRARLEQAVKNSGADGVITTRLVKVKKDKDVRTGFIMTDRGYTNDSFLDPVFVPADLFGFYGAAVSYETFDHQSVEVTMSTVATIETNLFDAGTGRLIWSGTTSALNPDGIITLSGEVADLALKSLTRDGLI
ncbi:MAG: hypothetical protein WCG31_02845 [Deltaproteobacteria bacterium]